jgi:hypothetical protein
MNISYIVLRFQANWNHRIIIVRWSCEFLLIDWLIPAPIQLNCGGKHKNAKTDGMQTD